MFHAEIQNERVLVSRNYERTRNKGIHITLLLMVMAIYAQMSPTEAIAQGVVQPWESPFLMLGKYQQEISNQKT